MVVPRDPPPLYIWEVLPSLYPPLDRPRRSRWRAASLVALALAAAAVAAAVLGGALTFESLSASVPAHYTVSGTVLEDVGGHLTPALGAVVNLTDDRGAASLVLNGSGRFSFAPVPSGGISINVSLAGFAPQTVVSFVSPIWDAGSAGLTITLVRGNSSNGTSVVLAPFPTLESFLASLDGGAALLGLAALVAGATAIATWRERHRTAGVIGGGAAVAVPAVVYSLGLFPAVPLVAAGSAVAAGLGAFALSVTAVELYRSAPAVEA